MSTLELRDITVERGGRPVVKDVTIPVPAGEVTALLGPNGAGKSSLVLAVGGVLRPRPGSVSLDGIELAGRRPERIRAAGVAIVPEGRRLLPDLTVDDNIKVATYALSKQDAAKGLGLAFAPRGRVQLAVRNTLFRLLALPHVPDLAMGRSLRDAVELPAVPVA